MTRLIHLLTAVSFALLPLGTVAQRGDYPYDPLIQYQAAKKSANVRDAWGAIVMVLEGIHTRRSLARADAMWSDLWETDVFPKYGTQRNAFSLLEAAAQRGLPTAMNRLASVYETGEYGVPADKVVADQWRQKARVLAVKRDEFWTALNAAESAPLRGDLQKMQGEWIAISAVEKGRNLSADESQSIRVRVTGTRMAIEAGGQDILPEQSFAIFSGNSPGYIELSSGAEGIFEFSGKNLTLRLGRSKPRDFTSPAVEGEVLLVLRRK